jgi:predicted outer membrane repeat protein
LALERLEDRWAPAVFNVNSLADILNPPSGVVTLRAAIQVANGTPGPNTINLTVPGTYQITRVGTPGETDNAAGEFAILPSGGNLTIQNTSGGFAAVDGNGLNNRVFDINPNASATAFAVTMIGFTIENGTAIDSVNPDGPNASGGGIRDQGNASLTLNTMVLLNNAATADGGGLSMENAPVSTPWTLTLTATQVLNNHAGDAGGGIETDGSGTVVVKNGSLIQGNSALNQGGGLYLDAIGTQSANLTMTNTLVTNNAATGSGTGTGGGISNAGNGIVSITGSTIANNLSASTGGGYSDVGGLGNLVLLNSLFVGNSAVGNGGGLFVTGSRESITSSAIQNNHSGDLGGGLFAGGTLVYVLDSTFSGNTSSSSGGAIEMETSGAGANASAITNTTIAFNRALNNGGGANGGGVDASGSFTGDLLLEGDTITNNLATNGGGIYWSGGSSTHFTIENTIIAKNLAVSGGADAFSGAAFTDNGGNLIGISGSGSGNSGFTAGTTQTGTPPSPLDPKLGRLQLNGGPTVGATAQPGVLLTEVPLTGSPVIDKGVLAGSQGTDERGYLRPDEPSEGPDTGAVEYLTPAERFVQALYLDELGRSGSLAELDSWLGVLNSQGRVALVTDIANSTEGRDHLVKGWYVTFLGRTAHNGEEMGWANLLASQTEEQVLSQLLGTTEFFNRAQTLGFSGSANSQFIQALYSLLLNRIPSQAEINSWVNQLPTLGRQGVASDILGSLEYRSDAAATYYITLLHRTSDELGLNHWATSGLDLLHIRIGIEASAEFFAGG